MKFSIKTESTVEQFIARLTDVEKIQIRMAQTPERLDHMRQNQFASDTVSQEVMTQAHSRLITEFRAHPVTGGF